MIDVETVSSGTPFVLHRTSDLRARFGSHWNIDWSLGRSEDFAREEIGRDEGVRCFDTAAEAIAEIRRIVSGRIEERGRTAARILGHRRSRLQILWARAGFGSDPVRLLAKVAELRGKVEAAEAGLSGWEPQAVPLPAELRGPVLLEQGRAVWLIRAPWPLADGVKVDRLEIRETVVHGYADMGSGHDIKFRYLVGEGRDAMWFSYDAADERDPAIDTGHMNHWAFLTREAALTKVAEVAGRLRDAADKAVRDMAETGE